MLRKWPVFPAIFILGIVLKYYFVYHNESTFSGVLLTLVITFILWGLIWGVSYFLVKDLQKSAFITFTTSTLIFSFQNFIGTLQKTSYSLGRLDLVRFWFKNYGQWLVFVSFSILIIVVILIIQRRNKILPILVLYLNIIGFLFLALVLIQGLGSTNNHIKLRNEFIQYWDYESSKNPVQQLSSVKPDIYYIIFDGFNRGDTLSRLYGFDNVDFIDDLRSRGVFVAEKSYSNYTQTRSSLASSLNMMYLDDVANVIKEDTTYYYPAYHLINNSKVEQILRSDGYEMVAFASDITFTDFRDWDVYFKPGFILDSYTRTYLSTTAFSVLVNPFYFEWHRHLINYTLINIPLAGNREGPQFVFAHFLCPHPPFVFNVDGSAAKSDGLFTTQDANYYYTEGTLDEYHNGYRNQVIFLQEQVLELIDNIQKTSKEPYVIILQGDHGSGMHFNQEVLENSDINERMAIFNSYYFYDQNYEKLYSSISPVNSFRVILSQYLGHNLPLIEDRHYFSAYHNLFNFVLVDHLLY